MMREFLRVLLYVVAGPYVGLLAMALLIGSLIAGIAVLHARTRLSPVLLFWAAFVLTRPFGATLGDVLTKAPAQGGLGFGTVGSSLILGGVLAALVAVATMYQRRRSRQETLLLVG